MATTFVDVLLQVREELGTGPLAGGKVHTYEAGTSTPLATYQDVDGATPNTNPVILDAAGMATVRQTNGVAYKWVITDSDDNELWTRDNITVGLSNAASGDGYLVHMVYEGQPGAQAWMGGHIFDDDVTFPIDLEGSQGDIETNPEASFEISIRKNGSEVATAAIATGGTYTFATSGAATVSFSAGDKMTFIAPDTADDSAQDFLITISGTVD